MTTQAYIMSSDVAPGDDDRRFIRKQQIAAARDALGRAAYGDERWNAFLAQRARTAERMQGVARDRRRSAESEEQHHGE